MLNRKIAPALKDIHEISFQNPTSTDLENGVKIYHINKTYDKTVRIDFIFNAGSLNSSKIIANITGDLLFSGSVEKTGDEIEETIDLLGGYLEVGTSTEKSRVSIYGLQEHIVPLTEIVVDAILNVNFNPREIKQLIQEKRKKMQIQLQKVNVLAKRAFLENVFKHTKYGELAQLDDFDTIQQKDLIEFHKVAYLSGLQYVTIVGELTDIQIKKIENLCISFQSSDTTIKNVKYDNEPRTIHIEKKNALQNAIRIGKVLFNKTHPEYKKFIVLNTVLGGYFGSRLMTSIREEKGYTYGIGSGTVQYKETGYFYISTEVASEVTKQTMDAIREEIEILQKEEISKDELELIKSYLIGEILEQSDGAQAMMDLFISVNTFNLSLSYYNELIQVINEITPKDIKMLAQKHLKWEDFTIITVGS